MSKRKKRYFDISADRLANVLLVLHLLLSISQQANSVTFNGIPAAFGDLDLNKRTDIVVIGDDGNTVDIYYQHQRQTNQPPLDLGFSCKSNKPIVQIYLADIDSDGNPNLLVLLLDDKVGKDKIYNIKSLKVKSPLLSTTRLPPSIATAAALNSVESNSTNHPKSLALKQEPPGCQFNDLGVEMTAQPLLFDLEGDLRTSFMSLDREGEVSVWSPPRIGSSDDKFEKKPSKEWNWISREYFSEPHSNAFIDINRDNVADIVLSASGTRVAYLYADPDPSKSFKRISKEFGDLDDKTYEYGQSSLVDINADGKIDHIIPRCRRTGNRDCEIIVLYDNSRREVIFRFHKTNDGTDPKNNFNYELSRITFADHYLFPITLRASDLDGDGYTDFVVVAKRHNDTKSVVVYLHNILDPEFSKQDPSVSGTKSMSRTFEIHEVHMDNKGHEIQMVTLFDINEDGKVDMLIGSSERDHNNKPQDLNISARMNTQMVDACFMKVLVTNGYCPVEDSCNGQSARGPFICFELSQNDGNKLQGCAGQLAQSSHFALQQPYVIFGLGQTPHFVETLNVTLPGFGTDSKPRTRLLEQIVPDAQVIIIPRQKDNPNSWDYKMFLSPMSDLVFSTLIALAVLCLLILFIIFILHRQETLEDAAEHEEYKRHWPESR